MIAIPESHRDIMEKSQIVALTTNGPGGFPQTTAIWFLLGDDDVVRASITDGRQKLKNMLRDPKVSLFFVDPENLYRTIEIRATAAIEPDDDESLVELVKAKYGADPRSYDEPGEVRQRVTFTAAKVIPYG